MKITNKNKDKKIRSKKMKKQISICDNCLKEVDEDLYLKISKESTYPKEAKLIFFKKRKLDDSVAVGFGTGKHKYFKMPIHFCDENCLYEYFKNLIIDRKNEKLTKLLKRLKK